jgi:glycosyltransferase involved in cell wall biosynthesis
VDDKATGLLVERSDAPALARALEELLANPELRLSLGRQASETTLRKFSGDRIVADLLAAYGKTRT